MKTRPYSNSTSDDLINFYDDWCLHCQHDAAWRAEEPLREAGGSGNEAGCEILLASGCFQIDDPNYPPEWIEDDVEWPTPSNPRCTAFKPILARQLLHPKPAFYDLRNSRMRQQLLRLSRARPTRHL